MKSSLALWCCVLSACSVAEIEASPEVEVRDADVTELDSGRPDALDAEIVEDEIGPDAIDTTATPDTSETAEIAEPAETLEDAIDAVDTSSLGDADEADEITEDLPDTTGSDAAPTDAAVSEGETAGDSGELDAVDVAPEVADDTALEIADVADLEADAADAAPDTSDASDEVGPDASACDAIVATFPIEASPHVPTCSEVSYTTNPPTSGPHYPLWAEFKTFVTPVNPGFFVHSMEHGAVVIQYHCDPACDAELAALADFLAARPADPACVFPVHARIVVTPSPTLDIRFAASAWGASWRAECLDLASLGAFIDEHYAMAPEDFCSDGVDLDTVLPDSGFDCPAL